MPVCSIFQTNILSTVASSGGTWCSEEGAAVTIRLGVTCKQLSVLATLNSSLLPVIITEKPLQLIKMPVEGIHIIVFSGLPQ